MNARTMLHAAFNAPVVAAAAALPSMEELQEELSAVSGGLQEVQNELGESTGEIDDLQDELASAQNLQAAVESLAGSTSPAAHRAVGIVLDHHLQRFGIALPSMENDAAPEEQTAAKAEANEGLIKRIIAAIKAAVERIKAFLKKAWDRLRSGRQGVKAAADQAAAHVEGLAGEKVTVRLHPALHDVLTYNGKLLTDEQIGGIAGTHNLRPITDALTPILLIFGAGEATARVLEVSKNLYSGVEKVKQNAKKVDGSYRVYGGRHGVETPFDVIIKTPEGEMDVSSATSVIHYLNGITFSLVNDAGSQVESQSQDYSFTKSDLVAFVKSADGSLKMLDDSLAETEKAMNAMSQAEQKVAASTDPEYLHIAAAIENLTGRLHHVIAQLELHGLRNLYAFLKAALTAKAEAEAAAPAAAPAA